MEKYRGIYATWLKQYIHFKRSLGYKFRNEYTYLLFDRFTLNEGITELGLTKDQMEKWSQKRPNESSQTRYHRVALICQFLVFLNGMGIPCYIPRLPKKSSVFTPYIFSQDEIHSFFLFSDQVQLSCRKFDTCITVVPALFRLLYATGIRLSEALLLRNKDINLGNNYLIIKESKNGKDRLIPFSESMAEVCKDYKQVRDSYRLTSENDYFFITHQGSPCPRRTVYTWFRRILQKAGISHGGRGIGPRIHDLRHTFSVHSLVSMSSSGLDLFYCLPILSTYLGHQSIQATEQYVRLTSEMYPTLLRDVNGLCNYVFPEISRYETN